jgi:hypothetical protein
LAGNTLVDRGLFHRHWLLVRDLADNLSDHLSLEYLFVSGDSNLRHGSGTHGLFYLVWLPLLFAGGISLWQQNSPAATLLLTWWLFALVPASAPTETPHAVRSSNALIPLSLLIAWGGSSLYQQFKKLVKGKVSSTSYQALCLSLGLVFFTLPVMQYLWYDSVVYPEISQSSWQTGYRQLATYLTTSSEVPVYVEPFDDRFYLWVLASDSSLLAEARQQPKSNFRLKKIKQINFESFPGWEEVDTSSVIVAGRPDYIQALTSDQPDLTTSLLYQVDAGQAVYQVVMMEL